VTALAALQTALAAEHQIVYGYGVVGAHLRAQPRRWSLRRLDEHAALRDRFAAAVRAAAGEPAATLPAYALPFPVTDGTSALMLAVHLEDGAAGAAWDVVAAGSAGSEPRTLGVVALSAAAEWSARWRSVSDGSPLPALPGRPG
jgi:hypothetical protein